MENGIKDNIVRQRTPPESEEAVKELVLKWSDAKNIAAAWERMDAGHRRVLFNHWVEEVHIVVERIPGKPRANNKAAIVWLKRVPLPQFFTVGR